MSSLHSLEIDRVQDLLKWEPLEGWDHLPMFTLIARNGRAVLVAGGDVIGRPTVTTELPPGNVAALIKWLGRATDDGKIIQYDGTIFP